MNVIHVNFSDSEGGAARAVYRIHRALLDNGVNSQLWVNSRLTRDWTVVGPITFLSKLILRARPKVNRLVNIFLKTRNPIIHSLAFFPSHLVSRINKSDADVVHLHWIGHETLSIADLSMIQKPIVWTLHDMWAFCGAEHCSDDYRWKEGYTNKNRPEGDRGFDFNKWTWQRKRRHWKKPMHIVCPSRWLSNCVQSSALMKGWPVDTIPNCLNTSSWRPLDKNVAREILGLPTDRPLVLFGSGSNAEHHKGFDLLVNALRNLPSNFLGLELVIFGESPPRTSPDFGFPTHYVGFLHDDISLRTVYSAADVMVVPSRQEAFCQTASEAHACGVPVVAFNIGGLPDIVDHCVTGYIAKAFDTKDLAHGISWVLTQPEEFIQKLRKSAREKAIKHFSGDVVARQYRSVYQKVIITTDCGVIDTSGAAE